MMIPSDSANKRLNDFSQVRAAFRSQNQISCSPPLLPSRQHYENMPVPPLVVPRGRVPVEKSVHQPPNFTGFMQHINFSVPPPFAPPVLPGPVFSAHQKPRYYPDFNLPNSAPSPGISTNQCDPNENKQCDEIESFIAEKILLRCEEKDERPRIQVLILSLYNI